MCYFIVLSCASPEPEEGKNPGNLPVNAVGRSWNREYSGLLELDLDFLTPQQSVEILRSSWITRGTKCGAKASGTRWLYTWQLAVENSEVMLIMFSFCKVYSSGVCMMNRKIVPGRRFEDVAPGLIYT